MRKAHGQLDCVIILFASESCDHSDVGYGYIYVSVTNHQYLTGLAITFCCVAVWYIGLESRIDNLAVTKWAGSFKLTVYIPLLTYFYCMSDAMVEWLESTIQHNCNVWRNFYSRNMVEVSTVHHQRWCYNYPGWLTLVACLHLSMNEH